MDVESVGPRRLVEVSIRGLQSFFLLHWNFLTNTVLVSFVRVHGLIIKCSLQNYADLSMYTELCKFDCGRASTSSKEAFSRNLLKGCSCSSFRMNALGALLRKRRFSSVDVPLKSGRKRLNILPEPRYKSSSVLVVGPIACLSEALWVHQLHVSWTDNLSEVLDVITEKCTFLRLTSEAGLCVYLQHFVNVLYMFLDSYRIYDDVTDVY